MTFRMYDTSIHKEDTNQIRTQTWVNDVNPSMCLKEEASKPSIKSPNSDKPSVIHSKMKAAEDELPDEKSVIETNLDNISTTKRVEEISYNETRGSTWL